MATYYKVFNRNDLNNISDELGYIRRVYSGANEASNTSSALFDIFDIARKTPTLFSVTVTIFHTVLSYMISNVENALVKAIDVVEEYEDLLVSGKYDLVEMKVTASIKRINGKDYFVPTNFECTRIHGGSGWVYPVG